MRPFIQQKQTLPLLKCVKGAELHESLKKQMKCYETEVYFVVFILVKHGQSHDALSVCLSVGFPHSQRRRHEPQDTKTLQKTCDVCDGKEGGGAVHSFHERVSVT